MLSGYSRCSLFRSGMLLLIPCLLMLLGVTARYGERAGAVDF